MSTASHENYLNIYYRGGCLLKLTKDPANSGVYLPSFDSNYLHGIQTTLSVCDCIDDNETVHGWASAIPELKRCMDRFFYRHPKNEREFAQNFVRENNRTKIIAPGPDYFICDVEYNFTVHGAKGQFDAVAVRWDSTSIARKKPRGLRLALIEFKFGDGALSGKAGIEKHISDAEKFLAGRDQAGDMRHVHHKIRADRVRDPAERAEVDLAGIGGPPGDDDPRLVLVRKRLHLIDVDALVGFENHGGRTFLGAAARPLF